MKNKSKWIIAILSAIIILSLSGCPEDKKPSKSKEAILTAIAIGDAADMNENTGVGTATAGGDYTAGSSFTSKAGKVVLQNNAGLAKAVNLTYSDKATATMLRVTSATGNAPAENLFDGTGGVSDGNPIPSLASGNFIFVRIVAEDGVTTNYYAIQVSVLGSTAEINSLKIGNATVPQGTPSTTIPTTLGKYALSAADKDGALVASHTTATINATLTISYAVKRAADAAPTADGFGAAPSPWEFRDGDKIYVKVVSQNGELTNYYGVELEMGRIATLSSVSINGVNVTALGTPNAAFASVTAGRVEIGQQNPLSGSTVVVTKTDAGATAKWAKGKTDAAAASLTYDSLATYMFEDGDFLFVNVESVNGPVILNYKIEILIASSGMIYYGQPKIRDASSPTYIDPLFQAADLPIYNVSRVNLAEQSPTYGFTHPVDTTKSGHTTAWAKALWDDDGFYVYVNVDFWDFYANSSATTATTRVFNNAPASGSEHVSDSLEIFTNERLQRYTSGNYGIQYRVEPPLGSPLTPHVPGARTSGDAGNVPSGYPAPLTVFTNSNEYNAWVRTDAAGKQLGYTVVARVPWIYNLNADANDLYDSNGFVKVTNTTAAGSGPRIGFELQLNTRSSQSTQRDAILTWNGVGGQSYQNCRNYGSAELLVGPGRTRVLGAAQPIISRQPVGMETSYVDVTATPSTAAEMSVTVVEPIRNTTETLTYQWYRATDATAAGTVIAGATTDKYTPAFAASELTATGNYVFYYYVVVTNTSTATGISVATKSTTSARARVQIDPISRPNITTQPESIAIPSGWATADRTVVATGVTGGTLSYKWYKATLATDEVGTDTGVTTANLPITDVTTLGTTYYWVVVTDTLGGGSNSRTSDKITVKILADTQTVDLARRFTAQAASPGNTIDQIVTMRNTTFGALPTVISGTPATPPIVYGLAADGGTVADGSGVQSIAYAFTQDQVDLFFNPDVKRFEVKATGAATPDADYRFVIGNVRVQNSWNGVTADATIIKKFSELAAGIILTKNATLTDNRLLSTLLIQKRAIAAGEVSITNITVKVLPEEPTPAP